METDLQLCLKNEGFQTNQVVRVKHDQTQSLTTSVGRRAIILTIVAPFAIIKVDDIGERGCLLSLLEKF